MASTGSDGSAQVTDMIVSWVYLYIIYFSLHSFGFLVCLLFLVGVKYAPVVHTCRLSRVFLSLLSLRALHRDIHIQSCITE